MSLLEKYRKVLELIKTGADLKDDTYVSQFLESTESVLQSKGDVDRLGILDFILDELSESNNRCSIRDNADPEEQHSWWNFLVDMAASVLKSVPEVTYDLIQAVGIHDVNSNANNNLIPLLQFYCQVFLSNSNILEIASYICKENLFWDKFLDPVIVKEKNKYATKATIECVADYVKFLLRASELNYKPKGCEIAVLLESNIKGLINKLKANSDNHGSFCDVFEILNKVVEKLDQKRLDGFLFPIIKENVNFLKVLNVSHSLTSAALKCYISTSKADADDFVNVKEFLQSIFVDPKASLKSRKMLIANIIQFPEFSEVLLFVLDQLSEKSSDSTFLLCQYFFSFHTVKSMMRRCEHPKVAQKVFNLLSTYLNQYSENLFEHNYNKNFIRNICLFSTAFLAQQDLSLFEVSASAKAAINIAEQKYEEDDYVRSDALQLLGVILGKVEYMVNLGLLVRTLCGLVCDIGAMNVVRDSALSCISSLLINRKLALTLSSVDLDIVVMILHKTVSGREQILKSGAVIAGTALIANLSDRHPVKCNQICQFFPSKELDPLKICDVKNDEERKQLMKLASTVHEKYEDSDLLDLVKTYVLTALDVDTNWDVKVHSVAFWKAVFRKACLKYPAKGDDPEFLKYLEEHSFFTGVILGYQDYEDSVKSTYFRFIKTLDLEDWSVSARIHDLKRKQDDFSPMEPPVKKSSTVSRTLEAADGNRDDEIEDILEENDKSLVKCLNGRPNFKESYTKPQGKKIPFYSLEDLLQLKVVDPESEIGSEAVLESVLDEIIHSCSDENLIDLVDCY